MKKKTYPRKSDIEQHKNELFTALIQKEAGYQTEEWVQSRLEVLRGDAKLWVMNNWSAKCEWCNSEVPLIELKKIQIIKWKEETSKGIRNVCKKCRENLRGEYILVPSNTLFIPKTVSNCDICDGKMIELQGWDFKVLACVHGQIVRLCHQTWCHEARFEWKEYNDLPEEWKEKLKKITR